MISVQTQRHVSAENAFEVLDDLTNLGASDIKFVTGYPPFIYRNGEWHSQAQYAPLLGDAIEELHQRLCRDHRLKHIPKDEPWDVDYRTISRHNNYRVNGAREQGRPMLILRPLPREVPDFEGLKLLDDFLGSPPPGKGHLTTGFRHALSHKRGLILVTGPTGSGKSTTLASFVDELNKTRALNIITIEDPIEFSFTAKKSHVVQREVGSDTTSFDYALRAALRQKPDVILVGEMRDKETIEAAFRAASTGHLVMSTLHNNEAAQVIERIINEFNPAEHNRVRHQLAEVLVGVFAQQLVPTIDGGRQVIHESMVLTPELRTILRPTEGAEGAPYLQQLRDGFRSNNPYGTRSFDSELLRAVKAGLILEEVAQEFAIQPDKWKGQA